MDREKIAYFAHLTVTAVGILALVYIAFKYLFFALLPFVIAWGVALAIRPLAMKISKATHIPCKVLSALLTILFVLGITAIVASAVTLAVVELGNFIAGLLEGDKLYDILDKIMNPIGGLFGDSEAGASLEANISDAIKSALSTLLSEVVSLVTSFASSLPHALFFFVITVIASIYFSLELSIVNRFVKNVLPKKTLSALLKLKESIFIALIRTIKSYAILMLITFVLMLLGLIILKVKYALLFAFIIALLDALPLIGVGTVLIPWGVYQIIFGEIWLGIGLLVLFGISVILRQIIEPKIVGKNLGVHPIVSLILLYVGYSLFGFFGLLLVPLLAVVAGVAFDKYKPPEIE